MLGGSLYDRLSDGEPVIGPMFYLIFCFTEMFLVLNMLCAVINESCEMGNDYLAENNSEYEIMDFMMKKFSTHPAVGWLTG